MSTIAPPDADDKSASIDGMDPSKSSETPSPESGTPPGQVGTSESKVKGKETATAPDPNLAPTQPTATAPADKKASAAATAPTEGSTNTCPKTAGSKKSLSGPPRPTEADAESVRKALFPTDAKIKEFGLTTGKNPNQVQLLQHAKFADLFHEYGKKPTPQLLQTLWWEAVQIQGGSACRRKAQAAYAREKTAQEKTASSAIDTTNSAQAKSAKRKRPDTSSTESLQTPDKRLGGYTIPRKPKNAAAGSDQDPPEGEVVEHDIDMDALRESLEDVSYADAVVGAKSVKEKKNYPFILFIHSGTEERLAITRDTWRLLSTKLNDRCLLLDLEDEGIESEFMAFSKGAGIVATLNEESMNKMKTIVATTEVAGTAFRAWSLGEKGDKVYLSARLPRVFDKAPAAQIMSVLARKNKLDDDALMLRSCKAQSEDNPQKVLKVCVTKETLATLQARQMRLKIGMTSIEFAEL